MTDPLEPKVVFWRSFKIFGLYKEFEDFLNLLSLPHLYTFVFT